MQQHQGLHQHITSTGLTPGTPGHSNTGTPGHSNTRGLRKQLLRTTPTAATHASSNIRTTITVQMQSLPALPSIHPSSCAGGQPSTHTLLSLYNEAVWAHGCATCDAAHLTAPLSLQTHLPPAGRPTLLPLPWQEQHAMLHSHTHRPCKALPDDPAPPLDSSTVVPAPIHLVTTPPSAPHNPASMPAPHRSSTAAPPSAIAAP